MFVIFKKYVNGSKICLNVNHIKSVQSVGGIVTIYTTLQEDNGILYVSDTLEDVLKCIGAKENF